MVYVIPQDDEHGLALVAEEKEIVDKIKGLRADLAHGINADLAKKVHDLAQRQAEIRAELEKYNR